MQNLRSCSLCVNSRAMSSDCDRSRFVKGQEQTGRMLGVGIYVWRWFDQSLCDGSREDDGGKEESDDSEVGLSCPIRAHAEEQRVSSCSEKYEKCRTCDNRRVPRRSPPKLRLNPTMTGNNGFQHLADAFFCALSACLYLLLLISHFFNSHSSHRTSDHVRQTRVHRGHRRRFRCFDLRTAIRRM